MNYPIINIDTIIARVLAGEAQVDDILAFNQWLNESESHWHEFMWLKLHWEAEASDTYSQYPEQAYEKHVQSYFNHRPGTGKRGIRYYLLGLAAAVILLLGIFVTYQFDPDWLPKTYYTHITSDNVSEFYLPDSSLVKLNKNSVLTYTGNYGEKQRRIRLEGEAFFDVKENTGQVFKVDLGTSSIEVLGTRFNVNAYAGRGDIVTTLESGRICFRTNDRQIILVPNEQLVFNKETGKADVQTVEPLLYLTWKDKLFRYQSIPVCELSKALERRYGVVIEVSDELKDVTVSGSFLNDQPIDEVLGIMQRGLAFEWEREGNTIRIH